jgi:WD40 repeat protein
VAKQSSLKLTKLAHLKGHSGAIYDFSLDSMSAQIYSVSVDGYIVVWSPLKHEDGALVARGDEAWYSSFFDEKASHVYAGSRTGRVLGIDTTNNEVIYDQGRHEGGVFFMDSVGGLLVSGGQDGKLVVDKQEILLSSAPLRCMRCTEEFMVIGDSNGDLWILDPSNMKVKMNWSAHEKAVFGLEFINADVIASTGRDAKIKLWDVKSGQLIDEVPAHEYQAKSLSFNGQLLLSCSMDKSIRIWDDELKLLKHINFVKNQGHVNCVNKVAWLSKELFVSSSDDRSLIVWQIELNT